MLLFGSEVDKAHLRLSAATAVLRLSMRWDSCVTPQLFHLTLQTTQVNDCALSIFLFVWLTDIVDEIMFFPYSGVAFLLSLIGSLLQCLSALTFSPMVDGLNYESSIFNCRLETFACWINCIIKHYIKLQSGSMFLCLFQDVCPYVRKRFLAKVHQYLKYKNLESKYACAFILITPMATKLEILEV